MASDPADSAAADRIKRLLTGLKTNPVLTSLSDISGEFKVVTDDIGERIHDFTENQVDRFYRVLLRSPGPIVVMMVLFTALIGKDALDFGQQINGDVEIYLPDGAESTELLLEVREQWSTDIVLLYIHTNNAIADPAIRGTEDITDVAILKQISFLEGDDDNKAEGRYARGIDWSKEDRGREDGVVWVLSVSQLVKESNSASGRFACATERYAVPFTSTQECPVAGQDPREDYVIPDNQEEVDNIIGNLGSALDSLVVDTNGDNINDTAVIVMGIRFEMQGTDIDPRTDPSGDAIQDHKAFLMHLRSVLDDCAENPAIRQAYDNPDDDPYNDALCARDYADLRLSSMNPERWDELPTRQAITITGLTPVLHDVSDAIYLALQDMLPLSLAFVCITMIVLHRNPKVLIICGTPIVMSLAVTFGATVLLDIMLTPMIIAAGPILIGLGVDYALHLINRIEENRNKLLEENA
ncbi:MAG: hypothetical protein CXX72_02105, partial [Methanobacteriota archaeon]